MKRRDFIHWVGLTWLATSLPIVIAALCKPTRAGTSAEPSDWQTVGTGVQLDETGQLLVENSPLGSVLIIGTSKSEKLIAVDPTCTHKGCTVTWKPEGQKFTCPCHSAEFAVDGKVQKGPAKKPLKTYIAKIERNSVMVKST
ncbi:cytochrome b6/f-complex iron-sulfur protein PetC [Calothrix brevissima NIES-22]|nr:cytochrome b6/f-complex iron-sulfur protein PetC [Calothrix brevissima NIES-22]